MEIDVEIWAKVPGSTLEVSSFGRVRGPKGIRKLSIGKTGRYVPINWWNGSKYVMGAVHRLVAQAYIPNIHNKPEINHIDGNPLNNWIGNLEWATRVENEQHKRQNLPTANQKLTPAQVLVIYNSTMLTKVLAEQYSMHPASIRKIRAGTQWSHITKPN